jgi:cytochrome c oxidase assembly protein subunit 15
VKHTTFAVLAACGALLALTVVMVGAYVRLSDAGLGCPDWPGCYGRAAAPASAAAVTRANSRYPSRPVDTAKARKEMLHR